MSTHWMTAIGLVVASMFCSCPTFGQVQDKNEEAAESSQQNERDAFQLQPAMIAFKRDAAPLLERYCYDCHGDSSDADSLCLDLLDLSAHRIDPDVWLKVLKNLRAGIMPPSGSESPSAEEIAQLENWIKSSAFGVTADQPNPGRVTLRRLNRVEYHNVIRDLLGFEFDAQHELPPDDVGYGFDNIGDVLSISPMRLEKFLEAAIAIVEKGVPQETLAMPSQTLYAEDFVDEDGRDGDSMSFYESRTVKRSITAPADGDYLIHVYVKVDGDPSPHDPQESLVHGAFDGEEFFTEQFQWADNNWQEFDSHVTLAAGEHEIAFTTEPVHPELQRLRSKMDFRMISVRIDGPIERSEWTHPPGFKHIYNRDVPPTDSAERREYAEEVLEKFASRAFRRPVSKGMLSRLVDLAEATYELEGATFEQGIAQSIVAILASPKFLFHLEDANQVALGGSIVEIDEYSLASRLSFALWRSLPDHTLTELAANGQLRANFAEQVERMIADPKSSAFVNGFSQQWLQTNVITDIAINSKVIMALQASESDLKAAEEALQATARRPSGARGRGFRPRGRPPVGFGGGRRRRRQYTGEELTTEVRAAMKQEVEAYFDFVMRNDRSVLEFLDSDYAFVNSDLAKLYGLPDVDGSQLRRVDLPLESPRGGVLTMGSVLTVTSNPTRTSPVKRGKWVLENILGAPSAPAPPDIPALEDTLAKVSDHKLTQRAALELHRADPMCASCHARMDPLGFALENFNGFGRFRTIENQQAIDAAGELITGEKFNGVGDLKAALVGNHKMEFYRTLAEKMLTYMTGRGMEYFDTTTIDAIAQKMDADDGRFSSLLMGVLESAPFQHRLLSNAVDKIAETSGSERPTNEQAK